MPVTADREQLWLLCSEVTALKEERDECHLTVEAQETRLEAMRARLRSADAENTRLRAEVAVLRAELAGNRSQCRGAGDPVAYWRDKVLDAETHLAGLRAAVQELARAWEARHSREEPKGADWYAPAFAEELLAVLAALGVLAAPAVVTVP